MYLLTGRVVAKLLHTRLLMVQPSGLVAIVQIERLKDWKIERLKDWKIEKLKGWKIEKLKGWKIEKLEGWNAEVQTNDLKSYIIYERFR